MARRRSRWEVLGRPRVWLALFIVACPGLVGCASAHVSYPYAPVPVLLSRVDRIGAPGPQDARGQPIGPVTGSVREELVGAGSSTSAYTEVSRTDPGVLTGELLRQLPRGAEVERGEVRLDDVEVWGYVGFHGLFAAQGSTGHPHGTVWVAP